MDHDAHNASTNRRLGALERFLDLEAPGWRTGEHRSRRGLSDAPAADAPLAHPDMHVDEDQTKADRIALGLDKSAHSAKGDDTGKSTIEDERRDQVLRDLEPYRGIDGVAQWDGTERTDQLEGILATARAREAGGGMGASRTMDVSGQVSVSEHRPETPRPNTMPPAQEVAVGAANASPETQQALETQNDPARAERAAEQREAKIAGEAAGGIDPASVKH